MAKRKTVCGLAAVLLAIGLAGAGHAASPKAAADAWRKAHEKAIVADFSALVAMPNVATNQADIEKNAAYIQGQLDKRGFKTQLLYAAPGTPPAVFAELKVPGARRTALFYAHYDGQPIGQKGWVIPPFEPSVRTALPEAQAVEWKAAPALDPDWRVYGRGSADDKESIQAMLSALDALKAAGIKPTVNVKLIYDGEEEQGSPHLLTLVTKYLDLLHADVLLMGDGVVPQSGRMQIDFGNRGITDFDITVYGPIAPLHDGNYGSWAPSPSVEIAALVTSLRDTEGHILISGFYDDVAPVSAADKAALAALPQTEAGLKQAFGLGRTIGPPRLADGYMAPVLNVKGIHVGDEGPHAANAIASEADAAFDIRLAPGQTPEHAQAATEAYLVKQGWFIVREAPDLATRLAHPKVVRVHWDEGSTMATESPMEGPAAAAVAGSLSRTIGAPVSKMPISGASSGIGKIVNQLKTPLVSVSIANYDSNAHARNENMRLGNLWDGIDIYAGLLADLDW